MVCETEQQNVADVLALLEQNEAQQQALQLEQLQLQWAHDALMAQLWGAYQLLMICLNNLPDPGLMAPQSQVVPEQKVPSFTEWLAEQRKRKD